MNTVVQPVADTAEIPKWSSSLDGIKATTTTLLETNNKLGAENRALNNEIIGLNMEVLKQDQTNKSLEEAIRQKNDAFDLSAQADEVRAQIAKKEKEIAVAKSALADLKARQQRVTTPIELRRLKLKQLELEKKAALLNSKANGNSVISSLEDDIKNLKERIAAQKGQEQYLQEQIAALNNKDDPKTARARQLFEENQSLRADLEKLTKEEQELATMARGELPSGTSLKVRADFQAYQDQEKSKRDLKDKIAKLEARKNQLEARMLGAGLPEKDLDAQIKALQGRNSEFETQLENLRENIAVLDYKINSLERYQNRNQAN